MDVFLHHWLGIIVVPLFLIFWFSSIAFLFVIERRRKRGPDGPAAAGRMRNRMIGTVLAAGISLIGITGVKSCAIESRFESLAASPPDAVVLRSGNAVATLSDQEAITELCRLLGEAPRVSAHHSHPQDSVYVTFPDAGYTYAIARDSERADEYWLLWAGYPGSGRLRDLDTVRHLRSEALGQWLARYAHQLEPQGRPTTAK